MSQLPMRISTLVSTKWVAEKLAISNVPNFRLLDASWHLPLTKRNPRQEFYQKHIPEAQFFEIDECCDKSSEYEHMLPTPEGFESYVGNLGICNDTHVVVYDNNESMGMMSAQRVWWTFRLFGHKLVSILDGGLPKWERDGYAVSDDVGYVEPTTFRAAFRPELVKSFEDIQRNLTDKTFTVIDARSSGRFEGSSPEPRAGMKPGHMPDAVNIPFTSILDPETKMIKSPDALKQIFKDKGIDMDLDQPLVATCGSGISACMLALGAHLCGRDDVMIYDGSWTEWYQRAQREHIITSQ